MAQATALALLGVVIFSWVIRVVSRIGKPNKKMLGERVLVGYVSLISIVGTMEVSR